MNYGQPERRHENPSDQHRYPEVECRRVVDLLALIEDRSSREEPTTCCHDQSEDRHHAGDKVVRDHTPCDPADTHLPSCWISADNPEILDNHPHKALTNDLGAPCVSVVSRASQDHQPVEHCRLREDGHKCQQAVEEKQETVWREPSFISSPDGGNDTDSRHDDERSPEPPVSSLEGTEAEKDGAPHTQ